MKWLTLLSLALFVIGSSACCPKQPVQTVTTTVIVKKCMTVGQVPPPPQPPPDGWGSDDHSTDPVCDKKWEFCADKKAAGKLVKFVGGALRYFRAAEGACRNPKETQ